GCAGRLEHRVLVYARCGVIAMFRVIEQWVFGSGLATPFSTNSAWSSTLNRLASAGLTPLARSRLCMRLRQESSSLWVVTFFPPLLTPNTQQMLCAAAD